MAAVTLEPALGRFTPKEGPVKATQAGKSGAPSGDTEGCEVPGEQNEGRAVRGTGMWTRGAWDVPLRRVLLARKHC